MGGKGSGKSTPKFSPDKLDIKANAIRLLGNVSALAEYYNVCRETMYQYLHRTKDGMEILKTAREHTHENFIDTAEYILQYNMRNHKNAPGLAQRSAEKVIDKKGHTRGWVSKVENSEMPLNHETSFDDWSKMMSKWQQEAETHSSPSLSIDESSNSTDK